MKVKYLSQYASTSRVGMIVPVRDVLDGETFEAVNDQCWNAGTRLWRNNMRVEIYGREGYSPSDRGFFNNTRLEADRYNAPVLIIERTP